MPGLLDFIPLPYRILGTVLILGGLAGGSYFAGYQQGGAGAQRTIDHYITRTVTQTQRVVEYQPRIVDRVVTQYVDRVRIVHDNNTPNQVLINTVVPDRNLILSNGWVSTHDASAAGNRVEPARAADATPSGITATQALSTISDNYTTCQDIRSQLSALQLWVRETNATIRRENVNARRGH